jgi:hypothetical protein
LPPCHPELYPIDKMWAMIKNWVAVKNVTFQLQDVRKLAEEKFSSITKDEWLPYVNTYKKWRRNTYKMNTWSTTLPRNWLSSLSHLIQTWVSRMKTTVWREYFLFRQIQSEAVMWTRDRKTDLNIFRTVNSEWPHWSPSTHATAAEAVWLPPLLNSPHSSYISRIWCHDFSRYL